MTDTTYLERALLGSLLLNPHRVGEAHGLDTRDFTDPLCDALWHLMRDRASTSPGPLNAVEVADTLARERPDLHPRLRTACAVAELMVVAPVAANIATYTRLIADATTRRTVITLGHELADVPRNDETARARIGAIRRQLAQQTQRHAWIDIPTQPPDLSAPTTHSMDSTSRRPCDPARLDAERAIVGAAIHDDPTGSRQSVRSQISASDLTSADLRAAWRAVDALASAGLAVDEVTVHWQLRRSAPSADLTVRDLQTLRLWSIFSEHGIAQLRHTDRARRRTDLARHLAAADRGGPVSTATLLREINQAAR